MKHAVISLALPNTGSFLPDLDLLLLTFGYFLVLNSAAPSPAQNMSSLPCQILSSLSLVREWLTLTPITSDGSSELASLSSSAQQPLMRQLTVHTLSLLLQICTR